MAPTFSDSASLEAFEVTAIFIIPLPTIFVISSLTYETLLYQQKRPTTCTCLFPHSSFFLCIPFVSVYIMLQPFPSPPLPRLRLRLSILIFWSNRSGAWDAGGVSNPELVDMGDGRWYLYYAGFPEREAGQPARSALGLAVATDNDLTNWTRIERDA